MRIPFLPLVLVSLALLAGLDASSVSYTPKVGPMMRRHSAAIAKNVTDYMELQFPPASVSPLRTLFMKTLPFDGSLIMQANLIEIFMVKIKSLQPDKREDTPTMCLKYAQAAEHTCRQFRRYKIPYDPPADADYTRGHFQSICLQTQPAFVLTNPDLTTFTQIQTLQKFLPRA